MSKPNFTPEQTKVGKVVGLHNSPYLHASLTPLDEVEFKPSNREPNMFNNECEGMCGV